MGPHEHPLDGSRGAQRGKGGAQASGAEGLRVTAAGLAERGGPGAVGGSGHTTLCLRQGLAALKHARLRSSFTAFSKFADAKCFVVYTWSLVSSFGAF